MASIETLFILTLVLVCAVIAAHLRLAELGKQLNRIELALGAHGMDVPAAPDQEVLALLQGGARNQATILYAQREQLSLRAAELSIQKLQAESVR